MGKGGKLPRQKIGYCPKCGNIVYENRKAYSCSNRHCSFALWKTGNRYFEAIGFDLTLRAAMGFLRQGWTHAYALPSKKKEGKTYDAIITVDFSGQYPQWGMEFEPKKKRNG